MATTIATAFFPAKNVPSKFFLASLVQDSVAAAIILFNSAFFDAKKYDHIYLKFPPFIGQVFSLTQVSNVLRSKVVLYAENWDIAKVVESLTKEAKYSLKTLI